MNNIIKNIDLSDVGISDDFPPLPPGNYWVKISNAVIRTSNSENPVLNIEFTVTEGSFENRKVFEDFVLNHQVGKRRLKKMLVASRYSNPDKLSEINDLIGLEAKVIVTIEKS